MARPSQYDIFENDPAGVFQRSPRSTERDTIDGQRVPHPSQQMIDGHNYRRGNQNPPIAIAGQERQGTKNMKMRLDTASRQMNQEARKADLPNGNCMTGYGLT